LREAGEKSLPSRLLLIGNGSSQEVGGLIISSTYLDKVN